MANIERLGFRFEDISRLHRTWGSTFYMWDIDFLVVESSGTDVIALVEYKRNTIPSSAHAAQIEALGKFATDAGRPFFIVTYKPDDWTFRVQAGNSHAEWDLMIHSGAYDAVENLSQSEYREFLAFLHWQSLRPKKVAS